jgi:hypothetical protein
MLNTHSSAPAKYHHPAIVQVFGTSDSNGALRCTLYHQGGTYDAWTWMEKLSYPPYPVFYGHVSTVEIAARGADYLLLDFTPASNIPFTSLLWDRFCPIDGVVAQSASLIDGLSIPALREFVAGALLRPDALRGYWESPASRRNHHAYPGGLAFHSLEVATMVATSTGLPDVDRELGIVYALLHDYGKIWCYDPRLEAPVDPRDHEACGREKLAFDLAMLQMFEPDLGARMEELLGGRRVPRTTPYPLAISRVVRAFDQMSCEKTRG